MLDGYRGNPAISGGTRRHHRPARPMLWPSTPRRARPASPRARTNGSMSIRSRAGIPGGTCGFDLPSYYAWQHRPALSGNRPWKAGHPGTAGRVHLSAAGCCGDSGVPRRASPGLVPEIASVVSDAKPVPQGRTFQPEMLRLRIDPAQPKGLVPEISGQPVRGHGRCALMRPDAPKEHFAWPWCRRQGPRTRCSNWLSMPA